MGRNLAALRPNSGSDASYRTGIVPNFAPNVLFQHLQSTKDAKALSSLAFAWGKRSEDFVICVRAIPEFGNMNAVLGLETDEWAEKELALFGGDVALRLRARCIVAQTRTDLA